MVCLQASAITYQRDTDRLLSMPLHRQERHRTTVASEGYHIKLCYVPVAYRAVHMSRVCLRLCHFSNVGVMGTHQNTHSSERARTSSITYSLRLSRSSTILISIGVVASPNSQSSLCPPDACPPGVVHSLPFSPQREPTAGSGGIAGFARSP